MTSILFLCLGNICRSPMAEGIFRHSVHEQGLEKHFKIDSAGNGNWHEGNLPDKRAIKTLSDIGIDITNQRSRPLKSDDFFAFDYILAMDEDNIANLRHIEPEDHGAKVTLFLKEALDQNEEVPDPYYGADRGFNEVCETLQKASHALLEKLTRVSSNSS